MKRYPIRAAKYALQLIVLFIVFYGILRAVNYDKAPLSALWESSRGLVLLGAVVVFALSYPFFGFTRKTLTFEAPVRLDDVNRVMAMSGYERVGGENNAMLYRAVSKVKRMALQYEDEITITTEDGVSVMEGPRKEVVKIAFRMQTYIG